MPQKFLGGIIFFIVDATLMGLFHYAEKKFIFFLFSRYLLELGEGGFERYISPCRQKNYAVSALFVAAKTLPCA